MLSFFAFQLIIITGKIYNLHGMHNEREVSKVVNTQVEIGDWNKKCELKLKRKASNKALVQKN